MRDIMKSKFLFGCTVFFNTVTFLYFKYKDKYTKYNIENKKLNKFNLSDIKIGDNIFIIGRRNRGKTTVIGKILEDNKSVPISTVISPTNNLEIYYDKIYNGIIHKKYNSDILGKFIKTQIENINSHIIEDNEYFIILDDCLLEVDCNDNNLTDLLVNGYFYQTINIIAASNPFRFGKYFKTTMDYIFIFKDTHLLYIKLIYEEYFKDIIEYKEFVELMDDYTDNYGCIIIDFKNGGNLYYY